MITTSDSYDVAIAGAGPAGTSAAIHLAARGMRVLLVERKKFPSAKLCGEFISPECFAHFEQLGVAEDINAAGGARLIETSFYSRRGNKVTVPSHWFGNRLAAIGLSRAEMDLLLLERAKRVGVTVFEDAHASDLILEDQRVRGIRLKLGNRVGEYRAHITIDATGRTRSLARRIHKGGRGHVDPRDRQRARLIAFKVHLENARVAKEACEIYFYPGGYGGLSSVEGGLSNLCFIASAKDVRQCDSDPERVLSTTVIRNTRAAYTLAEAKVRTGWLSVALESFGQHELVPAEGLLMIGDAAAFIDPFTGSGMLMALESGAVAAQTIGEYEGKLGWENCFPAFARQYRLSYARTFNSRLRVSGLLRRAAFIPRLAEAAMICFSASARLRRKVARGTRPALKSGGAGSDRLPIGPHGL